MSSTKTGEIKKDVYLSVDTFSCFLQYPAAEVAKIQLVPKHYSLRTAGSFLSFSTVPAAKLGINIDYLLSQFPKAP